MPEKISNLKLELDNIEKSVKNKKMLTHDKFLENFEIEIKKIEKEANFFRFMFKIKDFSGINTDGTYIEEFYKMYQEYLAGY